MKKIELDLTKLLGFKIVADAGSTVRLTSPKIGDKTCAVVGEDAARTPHGPLMAKIGTKTGIKTE